MGAGVSSIVGPEGECGGHETGLGDLPERCVAEVFLYLDPPEICGLARLGRAFRGAASADFVWETKLPGNYWYLMGLVENEKSKTRCLSKKEIYARLCRPNPFDGGTKEFWLEKCKGGLCMSISSKAMLITGIDDRRYWNYIPTEESRLLVMENCWDFLEWLGPDTSTSVLMCLNDPSDIVRASAVSRSWRRFVIVNGFGKKLCIRICPEVSIFTRVIEVRSTEKSMEVGTSTAAEWESLEREHKVYTNLSHCLVSPMGKKDCIVDAISASSTDYYPDESIDNTLEPKDQVGWTPSYWSSGGQIDPEVPETLTYRLVSKLCIINEIKIQPFKAFFQSGDPIYSAKSVRFRMGYSRLSQGTGSCVTDGYAKSHAGADDNYSWMYVSPEFPMVQENVLQSFKLPRPVICIGGMVQIELSGVDIRETVWNSVLKYFPDASSIEDEARESQWHAPAARIRHWGAGRGWNQEILNAWFGPADVSDGEDEDDGDEESFA
ncbi:putative F-box protein [Cocos nucifera]|uniref:Putative F-box protein n=1 Tax=Cocos nucifera TaxID=13894 RepID=A0A8K0ILL1_COCNU|nr:putative F-box protein [Cocos nucifera]